MTLMGEDGRRNMRFFFFRRLGANEMHNVMWIMQNCKDMYKLY